MGDDRDTLRKTGFTKDPEEATLEEAKEWLRQRVREGANCPCCFQYAKIYRRVMPSSAVYLLIRSYRLFGTKWYSVPDELAPALEPDHRGKLNGGDYAKLVYWGILQEGKGSRDDGSPRTGWFRVTEEGEQFVLGKTRLPSHVFIYDGEKLNLDDRETLDVKEALQGRFSYAELMSS